MSAYLPGRAQRGLTLIEMMLALAIGMVLLLGGMSIFASSNARYLAEGDSAQADEGGRYALDVVARAAPGCVRGLGTCRCARWRR
jgi:type IV pilus assembly protein PilW